MEWDGAGVGVRSSAVEGPKSVFHLPNIADKIRINADGIIARGPKSFHNRNLQHLSLKPVQK